MSFKLTPERGFHSTLSTTFTVQHPDPGCSFFALYRFPQNIIIDKHELIDRRLSFEFWGESNLELPVFALDEHDGPVLLINATPAANQVTVDIPIHARYGEPLEIPASPHSVTISPPVCFWACPRSASLLSTFSSSPPVANSRMLDSFGHFSAPSVSESLYHASLQVPAPSRHDLLRVEMGTASVILVAFLWLVYQTSRVATALERRGLKEQ